MEQAHHKTFGSPDQQDNLKDRIDSSDQDENASYEELDENDLKTDSEKYSEPEEDSKLNMENIQRLQKSLKEEEKEDSYSDDN